LAGLNFNPLHNLQQEREPSSKNRYCPYH